MHRLPLISAPDLLQYRWSEASSFFFVLSSPSHLHTRSNRGTRKAMPTHTTPSSSPPFHSIAGALLPLLPAPLIFRQQTNEEEGDKGRE